jgi:hypothetical protein
MGRDDERARARARVRGLCAVPATCSWRHSSTHHGQHGRESASSHSSCSAEPTRSVLRACVRDWQGPDGDDDMGRGMGPRWKKAARQLERQAREQPPCSFSGGHMGACDLLGHQVTASRPKSHVAVNKEAYSSLSTADSNRASPRRSPECTACQPRRRRLMSCTATTPSEHMATQMLLVLCSPISRSQGRPAHLQTAKPPRHTTLSTQGRTSGTCVSANHGTLPGRRAVLPRPVSVCWRRDRPTARQPVVRVSSLYTSEMPSSALLHSPTCPRYLPKRAEVLVV